MLTDTFAPLMKLIACRATAAVPCGEDLDLLIGGIRRDVHTTSAESGPPPERPDLEALAGY